jgi:hypothetical protein
MSIPKNRKLNQLRFLMKVLNHIKIFFSKLILGNLLTTSLKLVSENKVDLIDFQLSH